MDSSKRRPSPAMVIAVVALIAGLTGSAIALPGRNTVDRNDLKRNVVKTKNIKAKAVKRGKIAPNAINSSRIAANSVNGGDINEGTLGQVPSAASADSVSFIRQFNVRLSFGQDVELVSNGAVSLRARCAENVTIGGQVNRDGVQVYARTTAAGSFLGGTDNRAGDENGDGTVDAETLDPADSIDDSEFAVRSVPAGAPNEQSVSTDIDEGFVVSPTGSYIGVDSESLMLGVRALGSGCAVIGQANLQG